MIRPGEAWGKPTTSAADVTCIGDDATLARLASETPGALVRYVPSPWSDLGRAIGITGPSAPMGPSEPAGGTEVALDGIRDDAGTFALNAVVLGPSPGRLRLWHRCCRVSVTVDGVGRFDGAATSVVVASGQYLGGLDVVPRSHPGDGILEVQVYALRPAERREMRRRLASGTHVPHPRILAWRGRTVVVHAARALPRRADGVRRGRGRSWSATVEPGAVRLLV